MEIKVESETKDEGMELSNNSKDRKIKLKLNPSIPIYYIKFKNLISRKFVVHKIYNPLVTDKTRYFQKYRYDDENSILLKAYDNVSNFYIECSTYDEKTLESKVLSIIHIPNYHKFNKEMQNQNKPNDIQT